MSSTYPIFDNQNGYPGFIINADIPVEQWIHMCTDDPKTIEMAKLLAVDLRGVNSARGKASPGLEGLQSFKKRTKVVFDEQFKMEKIFYGPASRRLAGDIMRKQEAEYRQFQFDIASEAILLSQRRMSTDSASRVSVTGAVNGSLQPTEAGASPLPVRLLADSSTSCMNWWMCSKASCASGRLGSNMCQTCSM